MRVEQADAQDHLRVSVSELGGQTVTITSPVIEAVKTIQIQAKASSNTDSRRMQALAAANIAMNANQAVNAVQAGQNRTDGNLADQADTLFLSAGSDMTLRGAVAEAERVQLNTGGDLLIESLQDSSSFDSKQKGSSVGVSLCIPSFCHDTDTAHSAAQKQDADRLLRQVEAERAIKEQTFKMVATFTNEAYRSRFQQEPQPLKGLCPAGANCIADPSRIIYSHAAEDDIKNVEPGSIQAVNGILHDQRHRVSEQNYLHPQQDCFRPFLRAT